MEKSPKKSQKKLSLNRETVKNMKVKTNIQAGDSGPCGSGIRTGTYPGSC